MTITIDSWVQASDAIHATIDGFEADMYIEPENGAQKAPFAKLQMPQTKTGISIVNITQTLNVGEEAYKQPFIDYTVALMTKESINMVVEGVTHVHLKGLKAYKVNFKKTIKLTGKSQTPSPRHRIQTNPNSRT